jgi:hypothetical protein
MERPHHRGTEHTEGLMWRRINVFRGTENPEAQGFINKILVFLKINYKKYRSQFY